MKDSYVIVHKFMSCKLKLTGIELLTYATVYSYSKDGLGLFTGSASHIGEMFCTTRETVTRALGKLVDKGYILKEERFCKVGKACAYKINQKIIDDIENIGSKDSEIRLDKMTNQENSIEENELTSKKVNWETVYKNTNNQYDSIMNKFNDIWELYGKVGSKKMAFKQWYKLTDEEKEKAYNNIPNYFASLSDLKYRKHMERYISQEIYLQEFTTPKKTNNTSTPSNSKWKFY
ncbi:cyclic nucleotide-binding domain-containing protein [Fusobacterium varium]|uniref:Crp/Fnr family transcriptional regulator n=1 Tax=Fusobacterium varium ATCC 27725 TaxID=469618 RepID=A0ABM6U877_FUSVA|nr:Crp/Fnr family transcriptional regulator [Fusobacterium varium]AVQ32633.1 Crp/Fnr family transcriptional regulator [Fusobacterium varium ATCC 27725]EES63581.1 hypothetical protein FVAG_02942 [Fusobacterium varium ATCC 27725]